MTQVRAQRLFVYFIYYKKNCVQNKHIVLKYGIMRKNSLLAGHLLVKIIRQNQDVRLQVSEVSFLFSVLRSHSE